ncbi:uncharacterized protein LOC116345315 isoform X2 [Contarinia nasturtii]|uniref:uncharacterized protein LOC116345315 isoform X2 n=1 Tax=Contarinia nasturtii TaxID=265458 RepID=UPI0012D4A793|nr:uncharacterized protein LOC116345315 isoform X2 [Contarinia nasturtii]
MFVKLFSICAVVQLVVSQDLPITFKDGKIGVNFGGYHAEAGLGGLLTGNAAHGGLTASAGTPYGQTAHAGLGGNTGPNTRGGLFAGASAGNGVGASASLAGDLNNGGSFGVGDAEAHAGGISKSVTKTVASVPAGGITYLPAPGPTQSETNVDASPSSISSSSIDEDDNDLTDNKVPQVPAVQQQTVTQIVNPPATINVQKIKVRPRPQTVVQRIEEVQTSTAGPTTTTTSTTPRPPYVYTYDKQKVINEIFSIPIHALRAVNEIINAKLAGGYSVQKTITYN